jgi:hypothetical protein
VIRTELHRARAGRRSPPRDSKAVDGVSFGCSYSGEGKADVDLQGALDTFKETLWKGHATASGDGRLACYTTLPLGDPTEPAPTTTVKSAFGERTLAPRGPDRRLCVLAARCTPPAHHGSYAIDPARAL